MGIVQYALAFIVDMALQGVQEHLGLLIVGIEQYAQDGKWELRFLLTLLEDPPRVVLPQPCGSKHWEDESICGIMPSEMGDGLSGLFERAGLHSEQTGGGSKEGCAGCAAITAQPQAERGQEPKGQRDSSGAASGGGVTLCAEGLSISPFLSSSMSVQPNGPAKHSRGGRKGAGPAPPYDSPATPAANISPSLPKNSSRVFWTMPSDPALCLHGLMEWREVTLDQALRSAGSLFSQFKAAGGVVWLLLRPCFRFPCLLKMFGRVACSMWGSKGGGGSLLGRRCSCLLRHSTSCTFLLLLQA